MADHKDLVDAELHEPKHIQAATGGDSDKNKVIVSKGDGTSELRKLNKDDVSDVQQQVVIVTSESDFPAPVTAPDGVQRIPLAKDTCYIIDAPAVTTFALATPFWFPEEDTVFLSATTIESACNVIVNYTGTDALFYGPQISFISFRRIVWQAATPGTRLFDVQGAINAAATISVVETVTSSFLGFDMGCIVNVGACKLDFVAVLNKGPLQIHNSSILVAMDDMTFNTNVFGVTNEPCVVLTGNLSNVAIRNLSPSLLAGDSFLAIDSGITPTSAIDVKDTSFASSAPWAFFQADLTGSLTQMQNLSGLISGSVSSYATAPDGTVIVTHDSVTPFGIGNSVTHSGTSNYNGTHKITAILSTTKYIMDATYIADEASGSFVGSGTRFNVSGTHIIDNFRTVAKSGTTNYNTTTEVFNVTTNSFDTDDVFVADDATGSYTVTSLDQTSPNVFGENNGALNNSAKIATLHWNGNSDTTAVSDGTYAAVDFGGVTTVDAERFTVTDDQAGVVRCDAKEGFKGTLQIVMQCDKTGVGADNYRFAVGVDGATPVFATADYLPVVITTTNVTVPLLFPVTLNENQTVQLYVAGDGTGDDLDITDGYIILQE